MSQRDSLLPSQQSAGPLHGFLLGGNREGQTGPDFGNRLAIDPSLAKSKIKRKIVIDLPNRARENRERFRRIEFPLVVDLGDGADRPIIGSFENGPNEQIATMFTRQG